MLFCAMGVIEVSGCCLVSPFVAVVSSLLFLSAVSPLLRIVSPLPLVVSPSSCGPPPHRFSSGHPSSSSSSCFPPCRRHCRHVSLLPLPVVFLSSPFSSCFPPRPPLPYSFPLLQPLLFVMSPLVAFPSPRDLIHLPCRCCLVGLPAVSSIHPLCCRFAHCVFDWPAGSSIGVRVVDFPAASSIDPPCCQ